jgi:dethiobiotin synthetase/adenosylmethionine--8-amino-7-oxononanoate aminotransferase
MDCAEPCVYNEKIEWYEGKGYWFDYPTVQCVKGKWVVDVPESLRDDLTGSNLDSISDVFDLQSRLETEAYQKYARYIESVLKKLQAAGRKFGALMMEPVVLGAGGMILV